ncbi:MAG: CapA family protein [Lachnospiraceae bacterium]|nr:CapA family protein [Lachnospiraceae bacterium]
MKIVFTGDFFYDYEYMAPDLKNIGDYFRLNDRISIINYEGVYPGEGLRPIKKRGARLMQGRFSLNALKELSAAGVCLANNHTMDFGEAGLRGTLKALDKAGIFHAGAGMNLSRALMPIVLQESHSKRIAIFNFGWKGEETVYAGLFRGGSAPRERTIIIQTLQKYKNAHPRDDIIVVLHWSFEFSIYPMPCDIALAKELLGLDSVKLIIGHHPHNVQPVEVYNGKKCFFSLGNFYFGSKRAGFKREFPGEIKDLCTIGRIVTYDTETGIAESELIKYDRIEQVSAIVSETQDFLPLPKINPDSVEYEALARANSLRQNPILTGRKVSDSCKMLRFDFKRNFQPKIRTLMRLMKGGGR